MYKDGKVDSDWGLTLPKIRIILENASNKSCSAWNYVKRGQWAHMSISLGNEVRGLQRLPSLKYYNVQKWESRFSLGLNAAKSTDYMRKCFK